MRKKKHSTPLFFKTFFSTLWKGIKNNWAWKLTALILAVILWGGLISQNKSLTRPKTFENVPINVGALYTDTFKRNDGYIVTTDLQSQKLTATVTVNVPVIEYNDMTLDKLEVKVLNNVSLDGAGTYTYKVNATSRYGTIAQCTPSSVDVQVDSFMERSGIPVHTDPQGEIPYEDIYTPIDSNSILKYPNDVTVSGPESIVTEIRRVLVPVDLSSLPHQYGEFVNSLPFTLQTYNFLNKEYQNLSESEMRLMDVRYNDYEKNKVINVSVTQHLYHKKTVPIDKNMKVTKGTPREGFEVVDITITNDKGVIVYGDQVAVEQFAGISINADDIIDVTDVYSELKSPYLPVTKSISIQNTNEKIKLEPSSITVSYVVQPIINTIVHENNKKIDVRGLAEGFTYSFVEEEEINPSIQITGPEVWLNTIKFPSIELFVDVSDLTKANIYEVPIQVEIPDSENVDYHAVSEMKTIKIRIVED
ncbi:MAG: hypothetical protein GX786_09070 [Clostridiales bacterium]|nr:hypothetical protein [Clostridiales bacterium]